MILIYHVFLHRFRLDIQDIAVVNGNGKTDAAREIADRLEGKARQAVEVSGPDGNPIDVTFMSNEKLDARISELMATLEQEKKK
jgi:hypothetical protein